MLYWNLVLIYQNRYGRPLVQFDPEAERRLRWKIDLYVIPTVAMLYLFCFIDRANIGKAQSCTYLFLRSHLVQVMQKLLA